MAPILAVPAETAEPADENLSQALNAGLEDLRRNGEFAASGPPELC